MRKRRFFCRWIEKRTENNEIAQINLEQVRELIKKCENIILVDVRSPQEYAEGHIDGAILIPNYEIKQKTKRIIKDKDTIIVLYCSTGLRSRKAAQELRKLGYNNIYVLEQ